MTKPIENIKFTREASLYVNRTVAKHELDICADTFHTYFRPQLDLFKEQPDVIISIHSNKFSGATEVILTRAEKWSAIQYSDVILNGKGQILHQAVWEFLMARFAGTTFYMRVRYV